MAVEAVLSIKLQRNLQFLFFFQISPSEIILKQLFTSGLLIILNKNLDFVSVLFTVDHLTSCEKLLNILTIFKLHCILTLYSPFLVIQFAGNVLSMFYGNLAGVPRLVPIARLSLDNWTPACYSLFDWEQRNNYWKYNHNFVPSILQQLLFKLDKI